MPRATINSNNSGGSKKSALKLKNIILVLVIGFLLGFFAPARMFRKGGLLSFIAETDVAAVEKELEEA
jgi:hypothetical protein